METERFPAEQTQRFPRRQTRRGSIVTESGGLRPAYHASADAKALAKRQGRYRSMHYRRRALDFGGFCRWCKRRFRFGEERLIRYSERGKLRQCCETCAVERNYAVVRHHATEEPLASDESVLSLAAKWGRR